MARHTTSSFPSSIFCTLLYFIIFFGLLFCFSSSKPTSFQVLNSQNPMIQLFISVPAGSFCERIHVFGISRLNLKSYASSLYVTIKSSEDMPLSHQDNIEICFHKNSSLGIGQCESDGWINLQKGEWKFAMSPYASRFIDVKSMEKISGSIIINLEEEFQKWRFLCLGIGILLLLVAPFMSKWTPFYYSSSMALGVLLVILLILFQGMKLLPMSRKSVFYLTLYGSVLPAPIFVLPILELSAFVLARPLSALASNLGY